MTDLDDDDPFVSEFGRARDERRKSSGRRRRNRSRSGDSPTASVTPSGLSMDFTKASNAAYVLFLIGDDF